MNRNRKGERGTVIVMTAILMPVLIFLIGLAIDFGIMYSVRNAAQNAADAAAMAGVYAYAGLDPVYTDYNVAANKAAGANPVLGATTVALDSVTAAPCTDSLGIVNKCVTVAAHTSSPVFFAKVYGKTPVLINVTAKAQTNTGLGFSVDCAKPIFVPDPATLTPAVPVGGTMTIRPTCSGNQPGCSTGPLVPSNYYSLDFSSIINPANPKPDPVVFSDGTADKNSGIPTYADGWKKCVSTAVRCGQLINVQTGQTGNPTGTAVQQLIANGTTTVIAPMWTPLSVVPGNTTQLKIDGFILLDHLAWDGTNVTATYEQKLTCGAGAGVGAETGAYATPVRLVQ